LDFVIEDDKQYSPASIAGLVVERDFVAEGDEQFARRLLLAFSERECCSSKPGDARRAILFVAFGDFFEFSNSF
jgi:hypothetical protein